MANACWIRVECYEPDDYTTPDPQLGIVASRHRSIHTFAGALAAIAAGRCTPLRFPRYAARGKTLKLRYLYRLFAKELVLKNFLGIAPDQLLERLLQFTLYTEETLR